MSSIEVVDTRQFGRPDIGCAYLISGRTRALVDAGPASSVDLVAAAITSAPVESLLLTHVHPDHAGAAGGLAARFDRLRVFVHTRGRRHLVDPSALNASIREWTGPLGPHYGDVLPVPAQQIVTLIGGEEIDLGKGASLEAIDTPGHAPHHLCYFERSEGALFCGDALGIRRGDLLIPATVPPSFDLERSLATARALAEYRPRHVYYSHFGRRDGSPRLFGEYARALVEWVETIAALRRRKPDAQIIRTLAADPRYRSLEDTLRQEFEMCVRGALHSLGSRANPVGGHGSETPGPARSPTDGVS